MFVGLLVLAGSGCSLPGLTSAELFGGDSGPPPPDADTPDRIEPCPVGAADLQLANISGSVVDTCSRSVAALVGVTGQGNSLRTCSQVGKGTWQILGIKPGCHLTLAAHAPGWKAWSADVTILPGNSNPSCTITLEPQTPAPCDGPGPTPVACSCAGLPGCQAE
jgi:hypothetical protein